MDQNGKRIVEAEIEGDRWLWYYVCSECHSEINYREKTCRCCGGIIRWEGQELPKRKPISMGEQTEPAE